MELGAKRKGRYRLEPALLIRLKFKNITFQERKRSLFRFFIEKTIIMFVYFPIFAVNYFNLGEFVLFIHSTHLPIKY